MNNHDLDVWDYTLAAILFVFCVFAGVPLPSEPPSDSPFLGATEVQDNAAAPEPPTWRARPDNRHPRGYPNWVEVEPGEYRYIVEP